MGTLFGVRTYCTYKLKLRFGKKNYEIYIDQRGRVSFRCKNDRIGPHKQKENLKPNVL